MNNSQQICTFYLGRYFFGVEAKTVQEFVRPQTMTPVATAHPAVRGLINLRGQIVTALDIRHRLELPRYDGETKQMNVVVRTQSGGAVSFLVDRIGDVLDVTDDTFERPPETLRGVARELIIGAYKLRSQLLLILDVGKTLRLN
jgi:purine-binding chemotaxis protein CheW